MKRTTFCLMVFFVVVLAASAAFALQERAITDEPTVNKPHSQPTAPAAQPANSGSQDNGASTAGNPAERAFARPQSKTADPAPASSAAAPANQWTPPSSSQPADKAPDGGYGSAAPSGDNMFRSADATRVDTYSRKEIDQQVNGYFEGGARGLAEIISKAFERNGEPVGFIKGGEGAGALIVGLRYGEGWLHLKNGQKAYVYWQSPSIGFDLGVNASKVFCLVYGMTNVEQLYQRYPGVDGSAYVVGGFGMNYQRSDPVTLAPIRVGVGLRLGANVGYMHFTREKNINPF